MKLSFTTPCRFLPAHRNSKQIQMIKKKKTLSGQFKILNSGFACFSLFRISTFGFRILFIKDRPDDPAECVGEGGQSDSMNGKA
jgi:hypothetical protein